MPQRHRPFRPPVAPRQRVIVQLSDEELACWISARDAIEVLVAIATARAAFTAAISGAAAIGEAAG